MSDQETPAPTGEQTPPAGGNSGVPPTPTTETPPEPETISLSHGALNDRIARAKQSAVNDLLTELGLENADALKAVVQAERQRQEEGKSELERAQGEIESLKAKLQAAETRAQELEATRLIDRRNVAIREAAKQAADPTDVVAWANGEGQARLDGLLDEQGNPVKAKLDALVQACQQAKPHWFRSGLPGSPSNAGGRPSEPNKEVLERAKREMAQSVHF